MGSGVGLACGHGSEGVGVASGHGSAGGVVDGCAVGLDVGMGVRVLSVPGPETGFATDGG